MSSRHASRNVQAGPAREFVKLLESIDMSRRPWDVFTDWTVMASASIYNQIAQDPAVEAEYMAVAARYKPEALVKHGQLLGIALQAFEDGPCDFLGEIFEGSLFANSNHGQFFTPWEVSVMIASLVIEAEPVPAGRIITISEPACGAGGMALAACQVFDRMGVNYAAWVAIAAQDIDPTCSRMTYIQLALSGAAAVVSCGDTLRMTQSWSWPTPSYVYNDLAGRLMVQRLCDSVSSLTLEHEPEQPAQLDPVRKPGKTVQLDLFAEASA